VTNPPPDLGDSLYNFFQQWKAMVGGVLAIGVYRGIRMFIDSLGEPSTEIERRGKRDTAEWLSKQDRRFRDAVDRTDSDNTRLRDRIDTLEGEITKKDAEIEHERQSGISHYLRTIRIYTYLATLVHDWRNGRPPPDDITKIEDL
jgi:hypothetical protein